MVKEKREAALLEKARVEEKGYNWVEAARLYKQAAKAFLGKKMADEAAGAYKKLGYACYRGGRTAETTEEYRKLNRSAVKAYKEAAKLFKQAGNRPEEVECKAEMLFVSGSIAASVAGAKKAFSQAYEVFIESSEHYSKDDQESLARVLSRAAIASAGTTTCCSDRREIEQLSRKGRDVADKAWKLSKDVGDVQSVAESLAAEVLLSMVETFIVPFRWNERWREYFRKVLLKADESLKLAEGCDDPLVLETIYSMAGNYNCFFGFQFVEDEKEQREYGDKGLGLMEKALVFLRTFNIMMSLLNIWWFMATKLP